MKNKILAVAIAFAAVSMSAPISQPAGSGLLGRLGTGQAKPAASDPGEVEMSSETSVMQMDGAPLEMVLKIYGELVNKTIIVDPGVQNSLNNTIKFKAAPGQKLSNEERIFAYETILEMNQIHLEPYGDNFIRALPRKEVRKEGIPLIMDPEHRLGETSKVVSMMVPFKNITVEEAQKVFESLLSDKSGKPLVFERTNSILITDTEQNINRMLEIARAIDIETPVTEVVEVRQIKNASAQEIQTAIQKIVEESQKWEEQKSGKKSPAAQAAPQTRPASIIGLKSQQNKPAAPVSNESIVMNVSDAARGTIRGKVVIVADERSNKLIFVTSKSNMEFFDSVIEKLDVETTPDTVVEVIRLKYAECEDVSDMLNDLIGNAPSSKSSGKANQNQNAKQGTGGSITRNTTTPAQKKSANQKSGEAKTGELSKENTVVLADKRINGIVVMTNKDLLKTIDDIVKKMDVKLSQVLIETVIIEVSLTDGLETGLDWVHGMQKKGSQYMQALGGGGGTGNPLPSGGAGSKLIDGATTVLPTVFAPPSGGLSYALFSEKLNLSAVITASKSDTHSKYIASPVVMTVHNKEATIDATENRQFLTGWTAQSSGYSGGGQPTPNYSAKDIGLKLKITPKINQNGTVMLAVEEEYSQFMENAQSMLIPQTDTSGRINYTSGSVDLAIERKMSADILLENMQTVVLGGLTETKLEESDAGIPILKDIPWVGRWLFGKTTQAERRKELLVFLTPYVLDDAQSAQAEAIRRKNVMSDATPWDDHGWSASELADPVATKEQMRRIKAEAAKQDEERASRRAIEQWKAERARKLQEMSKEEREQWLRTHGDGPHANIPDDDIQDELKKLAASIRDKKSTEGNPPAKAEAK